MKLIIKANLICLLILGFFSNTFAQDVAVEDNGDYVKSNIAVSHFKILGVTRKQYARCIETENYLEPDKKLKFLVVDKTSFADDGQGYDLKEGDGILTSTELSSYNSAGYVLPGDYKESEDYNTVIADESFAFYNTVNQAGKIKVICRFKWVPCNQMSNPGQIWLCNWAGWPYGSFVVTDCEIHWE